MPCTPDWVYSEAHSPWVPEFADALWLAGHFRRASVARKPTGARSENRPAPLVERNTEEPTEIPPPTPPAPIHQSPEPSRCQREQGAEAPVHVREPE